MSLSVTFLDCLIVLVIVVSAGYAAWRGFLWETLTIFAWVALLFTGKYPQGLYNLNSGFVRYRVRTASWIYLQSDEWPPFGIGDDPSYPLRVEFAGREEHQSRLKVFFRIILALPLLVVVYAVAYVHMFLAVIAWLTIVFRGYLPEGVNDAMTFCNGFYARLYGYLAFLTDAYPPIGLEKGKGPSTALAEPSASQTKLRHQWMP